MHTSPYLVPVYRVVTIVSTVLSCDKQGDMVHALTVDTTLPDEIDVVYELI